jgi:hypothetical protein
MTNLMADGIRGVGIGKTADFIRRCAYVEQSLVRSLAGWFLKAPKWETKIRMGYLLYAHAEHVHDLTGKLDEMRGGNRHVSIDPDLEKACEEVLQAPDAQCFLAGYAAAAAQLGAGYRDYIAKADDSANAPEIRMFRRICEDLDAAERTAEELAVEETANENAAERAAWAEYVRYVFAAAGGVSGAVPRPEQALSRPAESRFEWPSPIVFDDRLKHAELGTYEEKKTLSPRERAIGEFEVYFNEFYAAALLATVLYDSWKLHAPRQYFMDIARHFWDEVRHAEFGAVRLRELGVEPSKINMSLFEHSRHMPILHRFCYLTYGLEVFFMPRKSERTRYYEQAGDARSQLFADVDWSEEINHVNYGKRWVNHFLENDARTVQDIQDEISEFLARAGVSLPEGRKAPW